MAKFEKTVHGDFNAILNKIDHAVINGSMSATYEDGSDYVKGDFCCAVRVYERFSAMGGNRVSMNITLTGSCGEYFLSAITSGGSQGIFLKINTWGEESFLDTIAETVRIMESE